MAQQRETATDRLVSIIQLIQLGRRTGLLTAKRGEGIILEESTITFVKGQVTQASVGRRNGPEALNWLTSWGSCRFTFISSDPAEDNTAFAPAPSNTVDPIVSVETTPSPTPHTPVGQRPSGTLPWSGESGQFSTPQPVYPAPYRILQLEVALRAIDVRGLSRAHRRLLLLVNGERTVPELGRLMGRDEANIAELLRDLEWAAVIQIPTMPPYR